jgi:photosystem II stability/assembly factor-like uncharacterized protein
MRNFQRLIATSLLIGFFSLSPANSLGASFDSVTHIHGVKAFGKEILMPTHEGLYKYSAANSMTLVKGPVFDVMGLAGFEKTLYASGHPGVGTKFLNPIGLIQSTDGGSTWKQVSLAGQVDFHLLEVGKFDIYGVDAVSGVLMHSIDQGKSWKKIGQNKFSDIAPVSTKKSNAYALLSGNLVQTKNSFKTSTPIKSKQKWESLEVLGNSIFTTAGKDIYSSTNEGKSWTKIATLPQKISSISVNSQIFVAVAGNSIYSSKDGGKTFKS